MREKNTGTEKHGQGRSGLNDRGIALIIVLLVTALLIALIFEFAYGTRVSLRAAVNYRNSERAYYLARSGVNAAGRLLTSYNLISSLISQGTESNLKYKLLQETQWQYIPFQAGDDAKIDIRWDDEASKIRITDVQTNVIRQDILNRLFESKGIDRTVLDRLKEISGNNINRVKLLTELHQYMTDEDFDKVSPFLTVRPEVSNIDINTASLDVLTSMNIGANTAGLIIEERQKAPITDPVNYVPLSNVMITGSTSKVTNFMTDSSDIFTVYSRATVGGYTRVVQAIIQRNANGFTVLNYWTVLDTRSVPGIESES